jgi:uncharacterized protein YijF (DUF1287 family)
MHSRRTFSASIVALLSCSHVCATASPADVFSRRLVEAARERTLRQETYDGTYRRIPYPLGDVPDHLGVCTDLVVRAYRRLGVDLQALVHQDMTKSFRSYPAAWGLKAPDPNIDHRRVPNLQVFFARHGKSLAVSDVPTRYLPGSLVTWRLPGNLPHIGIVSDQIVPGTRRPRIIHNIGAGPVEDDILFSYPITGHYRYPR